MTEYIDREVLLQKAWDTDTRVGYVQVVDVGDILDMPVANVALVVHGQWLDNVDYMFCSKCGMKWNYYDNDTQDFKYCPNCGAKMDGGDENGECID